MKLVEKITDYIRYRFDYLKILNSPLKRPHFRIYFGKPAVGVPYNLPSKRVKLSKQEREKLVKKMMLKPPKYWTLDSSMSIRERAEKHSREAHNTVDKTFGLVVAPLGWKTKFNSIRFETDPVISLSLWKWQLAIIVESPKSELGKAIVDDVYWETWLYYDTRTDKNLSTEERLKQVFSQYSATWRYLDQQNNNYISTCYFYQVLKDKYHHLIEDEPVVIKEKLDNLIKVDTTSV